MWYSPLDEHRHCSILTKTLTGYLSPFPTIGSDCHFASRWHPTQVQVTDASAQAAGNRSE
jgi:hypothetical protein